MNKYIAHSNIATCEAWMSPKEYVIFSSYLTANKMSLHYKCQPFNVVKGSNCYFSVRTVANTQIYSGQNAQLLKAEGHTVTTMLQRTEMY
jgi:hypothetical protein